MTRVSSPELIGRSVELARLLELTAAEPSSRRVILISGEAGIGKTRLLDEWAAAATSTPFLRAACIDAGAGLAHMPILDLLDQLATVIGVDTGELRAGFGGTLRSTVDSATDTFGTITSDPGKELRFLQLRDLLVGTAAGRPMVAIIDDLHWADRSSLDVVSFLARRLSGSNVVLALTYRSDEIMRRHPLRPVITALERDAVIDHIRLEPLGADDVGRQIDSILDTGLEPARVATIIELADGNPFHVEELLALDAGGPLPASLGEVLRVRLDRLDDSGRAVVAHAAAIGREFDVRLLEATSTDPASVVRDGLHRAVDAGILVSASDERRIRFRHALIREAAYDDLLPTERLDLHRGIATALESRPELADPSPVVATTELARQWSAALDDERSFASWLVAARTAESATAWHESVAAYEHAMRLWDRVRDPVSTGGGPRSVVIRGATRATWLAGDTRRAVALNRLAQAEPDVAADPWILGDLLYHEVWFHDELGDQTSSRAAATKARLVVPTEPPSALLANLVGTLGSLALRDGSTTPGIEHLGAAIAIAEAAGAADEVPGHTAWLGLAQAMSGDAGAAHATVDGLLATSLTDTDAEVLFPIWTVVPYTLITIGQYERAIETIASFRIQTRARGLESGVGAWMSADTAWSLYCLGRWTEALEHADDAAAQPPYNSPQVVLHSVRTFVYAGRGDVARARASCTAMRELVDPGALDHVAMAAYAGAFVEWLAGSPGAALRASQPVIARVRDVESQIERAQVLLGASLAAAEQATMARASRDVETLSAALANADELEPIAAALRGAQRASPIAAADTVAATSLGAMEVARIRGDDDEHGWAAAIAAADAIGNLPLATIGRLHHAEAILRDRGDTSTAEATLRIALDHATTMGANAFIDRIEALARAARLRLEPPDDPPTGVTPTPHDPWGLSEREREVLFLLADGRTNRQIGDALFISDKTASVHVTHILAKMGVSSRTEAALLAARAGATRDGPQGGG